MFSRVSLDDRRKSAAHLVRETGNDCLKHFRTELFVKHKAPGDVVTDIDISMETQIRARLKEAWPSDGVFGEELSGEIHDGWVWVIDPIDGTSNFCRGTAHWCVSIGALFDGVPVVGAVYDPVHNELFDAAHGQGATLNDLPLERADNITLHRATVGVGITKKSNLDATLEGARKLAQLGTSVRSQGAAALTLCHVACGRLDGFVEDQIHLWDACAAMVVLNEAGCSFQSTFNLRTPDSGFSVCASVRPIQDQIRESFRFFEELDSFG
ncbi:MAG: inositol monophosphatase family protein [Pseudomonadota bacterium]